MTGIFYGCLYLCLSIPLSSSENAIDFSWRMMTCFSNLTSSSVSQPSSPKLNDSSLVAVIFLVSVKSGGKGVRGVL